MRKTISMALVLLVASLVICDIVYAQTPRAEKIKAEIAMHRQAIERLKAELVAMGVPPPGKNVGAISDVAEPGITPAEPAIVPPPHHRDMDNNPPGPQGGPGTNWENPPGPQGGPGTSPNRRHGVDRDNNPPGPQGGRGTNWENPPGPQGGPGTSPNRRDGRR